MNTGGPKVRKVTGTNVKLVTGAGMASFRVICSVTFASRVSAFIETTPNGPGTCARKKLPTIVNALVNMTFYLSWMTVFVVQVMLKVIKLQTRAQNTYRVMALLKFRVLSS